MNLLANIVALESVLRGIKTRVTSNWMRLVTQRCVEALHGGGKILICGNGGSYCDAEHFAEELTGRLYRNGKAIAALNVGIGGGHMTCVGNDYGFEKIFERGVEALGNAGDVLICLSTSGKSPNVIRAAQVAKERGLQVFLMTGFASPTHEVFQETFTGFEWLDTSEETGGGPVRSYLCIPSSDSARIQEAHKLLLHSLAEGIEDAFRGNLLDLPGSPSK